MSPAHRDLGRGRAGGPTWPQAGLLVAALVLCTLALTTFRVTGHDTWLHLAIGRHVVRVHAVPHADPFSHTVPGAPWTPHEWLAGVVLWLVERAGGTTALILLRIATVLSFLGGWLLLCRGRPGALWGVALVAPFALSMAPRFLIRPFLFSGALAIWQIVLLDAALRRGRRWTLWLLPPLYVLWINLHSGAVLGWAYLVCYAVGILLQAHARRQEGWFERADLAQVDVRAAWGLLPWVAAAGVAMLLNPNGVSALLYPFRLLPEWIQAGSVEHRSTWAHLQTHGGLEVNRLVLLTLVVMGTWACALGRLNLGATALMLLVTALAVWRVRNVVDFGLLAVALIGPAFGETLAGVVRRLPPGPTRLVSRLLTATLVALALVTAWICFPSDRFGFGVDTRQYPGAALDFLAENRPPVGEGFNSLEWGGAVLWHLDEQAKVYVDGRLLVYGRDFFSRDYARVAVASLQSPSWREILHEHDVSWVLIDRRNEGLRPLTQALYRRQEAQSEEERDWGLAWFDDTALIFFRRDAFSPEQWSRVALGFRADVPWMAEQSPVFLRRHPEWREHLVQMIEDNAENETAVRLLLTIEEKTESHELRTFALERLLTFPLADGERAQAEHTLGLLGLMAGDFEGALGHLQSARALEPESAPIRLALAQALWGLHREEETVAAFEAVLEVDPRNEEARAALREYQAGTLWDEHPSAQPSPEEPATP